MNKMSNKRKLNDSAQNSKKKNKKRKIVAENAPVDPPVTQKPKWTNKERVLIFSSRGISHQHRHLMKDFRTLMPHSKSDTKMDRKDQLFAINESLLNVKYKYPLRIKKANYIGLWNFPIVDIANSVVKYMIVDITDQDILMTVFHHLLPCSPKLKKSQLAMMSNTPAGPSVKFLVENIHTMSELKMTGNCLKGSRPLLSFDKDFDSEPHWKLLKELFIQTFSTPNYHPKSQPFIDHVLSFSIADNRIWFRNYQILEENGELAEIGPRMVLNPIRIFNGSFVGETLYQNPHYVSPNEHRREMRKSAANRYVNKLTARKDHEARKPEITYRSDPTDVVFETL